MRMLLACLPQRGLSLSNASALIGSHCLDRSTLRPAAPVANFCRLLSIHPCNCCGPQCLSMRSDSQSPMRAQEIPLKQEPKWGEVVASSWRAHRPLAWSGISSRRTHNLDGTLPFDHPENSSSNKAKEDDGADDDACDGASIKTVAATSV